MLHYAMNLPTSVVITGCDSLTLLQQALRGARLSAAERSDVDASGETPKAAEAGKFETV